MRYTTRIIVPPRVRRSGQPGTGGAYRPQVLGVRKSFGFDDPFGLATAGHIDAAEKHPDFAPLFTQHDFGKSGPIPGLGAVEAMAGVMRAVNHARFRMPWGADANLLKSPQDVEDAAAAGFTYYTLDPSDFIYRDAARLTPEQLAASIKTSIEDGDLPEDWAHHYADRTIDLPGNQRLLLPLEPLQRAAVKYAKAIRHCGRLSETAARASQGRPYEMEAFFALPGPKITPLEHMFVGLELEARGIRLTSLALPFIDDAERQAQPMHDGSGFEQSLREHAAVAEFCGPYKLSFHGICLPSDILPIIGRCCGERLHVKSCHLSFLQALRVVLLTDPGLFDTVASSLGISPTTFAEALQATPEESIDPQTISEAFLRKCTARLDTSSNDKGLSVRAAIVATLERHVDIYQAQLTALFDKQLSLLKAG